MKCYVYTNEWHNADLGEGSCFTRVFTSKDAAIDAMNDDVNEFEKANNNLLSIYDVVSKEELSAKYYNDGHYYDEHQIFNVEEVELEDTGYITLTSDNWIRSEIDFYLENIDEDPKDHPELVNRLMDAINGDKYLWDDYSQSIYAIVNEDLEYSQLREKYEQGGSI